VRSAVRLCLTSGANSIFLQPFPHQKGLSFEQYWKANSQKLTTMKTTKLITTIAVSAGLAFGVAAQAGEKKHEEQSINSSEVPAAVQSAAQAQAQGGTIVRWEKEGANFEAVINKNGRQIGIEMDANGKVLSKHDEAKEHKEKGAGY